MQVGMLEFLKEVRRLYIDMELFHVNVKIDGCMELTC